MNMSKKRKITDFFMDLMSYAASSITIIILVLVFGFVISTGKGTLSKEMLTQNYWSKNVLVNVDAACGNFVKPEGFEGSFSTCYGIGFEDQISHEKKRQVVLTYIDPESSITSATIATQGADFGVSSPMELGDTLERISTSSGDFGMILNQNASEIQTQVDQSTHLETIYYKSPGGGIFGSIISTLMLIGVTLLIALPLGVGAAVYLNELADDTKFNRMIGASIEMLAGIPSIVFGLMGIIVLFPVTALFKIEGVSILLGALTMAIMLLPIVIRSVQEALLVVPRAYRLSSLSLGANETQTIFKVVLPSAIPGIMSAVLLSISRIIGESAALIYTMGTFINDSPKLGQGATTLAVHIWSVMAHEQPNFELAAAISIVILVIVLILNIVIKILSRRYRRKLGLA